MEQTFVQARVQCLEFSNGRIRVARSGQDRELRWFFSSCNSRFDSGAILSAVGLAEAYFQAA